MLPALVLRMQLAFCKSKHAFETIETYRHTLVVIIERPHTVREVRLFLLINILGQAQGYIAQYESNEQQFSNVVRT